MKKLIAVTLFILFMLMVAAWPSTSKITSEKFIGFDEPSLMEKVISHPDAVEMGTGWYRIVIKENLSDTEYDWRFDLRMIQVYNNHIIINHRLEQNSGNHPDSNWVIEYTFLDYDGDDGLDGYLIDRFISVKDGEGWYRITPYWPDKFNYPQDNINYEEANELFQKELEYWKSKL